MPETTDLATIILADGTTGTLYWHDKDIYCRLADGTVEPTQTGCENPADAEATIRAAWDAPEWGLTWLPDDASLAQITAALSAHDIPVQEYPTRRVQALRLIEGACGEPLTGTLDEIATEALAECEEAAEAQGFEGDNWTPTPADCEYVQAQLLTAVTSRDYTIRLDGGNGGEETIQADSLKDAIRQAREWADEGDWSNACGIEEGDGPSTIWVDLSVSRHGEELHYERYQIDPPEPDCTSDKGHDWQSPIQVVGGIEENPGVQGHGGGVVIHEVCVHCGYARITDTWAQDMETGEQGLNSVSYSEDLHREAWEEWRDGQQ